MTRDDGRMVGHFAGRLLVDTLRAGDYLTCPGCRTINPLDELDPASPVCAECGRCL